MAKTSSLGPDTSPPRYGLCSRRGRRIFEDESCVRACQVPCSVMLATATPLFGDDVIMTPEEQMALYGMVASDSNTARPDLPNDASLEYTIGGEAVAIDAARYKILKVSWDDDQMALGIILENLLPHDANLVNMTARLGPEACLLALAMEGFM